MYKTNSGPTRCVERLDGEGGGGGYSTMCTANYCFTRCEELFCRTTHCVHGIQLLLNAWNDLSALRDVQNVSG